MIAQMRRSDGKHSRVSVIRQIGDGFYYLVDDFTGRPARLVRYDRLSTGTVPMKGPKVEEVKT